MQENYHIPVMLKETVDYLVIEPNGIYVDGTLGGGGHSKFILSKLVNSGRVFGIDQDDEALKEAKAKIGDDARFEAIKGNFGFLDVLLDPKYKGSLSGILVDLGVSSHQIDESERGFSFQEEGPLDMRMGNLTSLTAEKVVNEYSLDDLKRIFFQYGEEKLSGPIAKVIVQSRPLSTTADLKKCITSVVKGKFQNKSLARIFQAIRIEVNRELEMLKQFLKNCVSWLKDGGRLVVLSYHSLEDRLVKQFMKTGSFSNEVPKDVFGNNLAPFKLITRKPIEATNEEIAINPRARSARLRVAERKILREVA